MDDRHGRACCPDHDEETGPHGALDPDAIAQTYRDVLGQPRNAWTQEVDLRPWAESF